MKTICSNVYKKFCDYDKTEYNKRKFFKCFGFDTTFETDKNYEAR